MLKSILLSTAALALFATAANARPSVFLSPDKRTVATMTGQPKTDRGHIPGKINNFLYRTLANNPEGRYFCCYGSTLSGPSSFFGAAYGVAEQFTLKVSAGVTELSAGVGYVSGDDSVTLTLYADNGSNSPGAMLAQGTGTTTTEFGFCCGETRVRIPSTTLAAHTPYWVGITTTGSNFEAAGFQVNDEVDNNVYVASTSNGGSTWSSGFSESEYNPAIGVK